MFSALFSAALLLQSASFAACDTNDKLDGRD